MEVNVNLLQLFAPTRPHLVVVLCLARVGHRT